MKKQKSSSKAVRSNPVAKYARRFNKAAVHRDRTRYSRKDKSVSLNKVKLPDDSG